MLVLRDEAVTLGIVAPSSTVYRVSAVDEAGRLIADPIQVRVSDGALFPIRLPAELPAYSVLRVTAVRGGSAAPRPMEVHLVHRDGALRVVGVVH